MTQSNPIIRLGLVFATLAAVALAPGHASAEVDICEELVTDLLIPPTFEEVVTCNTEPFLCLLAPHCCLPGVCAADPLCTVTEYIPIAAESFEAGEIVCGLEMEPLEFVDRLQDGLITNAVDLSLGGLPGHFAAAVDATVFGMTLRGTPIPSGAAALLQDLSDPFSDDPRSFSGFDLAQVRVLPNTDVDAAIFLPPQADGMTLGNLVILREEWYEALYNTPDEFDFDDLVSGDAPAEYMLAIEIMLHEMVHVRQYREDGQQTFWTNYLLEASIAAASGGLDSRELEAYMFGADVDEFHGGWPCRANEDFHNGWLAGYRAPVNCYTNNESEPLVDGTFIEGKLGQPGPDSFVVELEAGERLELQLATFIRLGDLDLFVFDPSDDLVVSSESDTDGEAVEFTAAVTGLYSVIVGGTQGPYDLSVMVTPSQSGWSPGPGFTKK